MVEIASNEEDQSVWLGMMRKGHTMRMVGQNDRQQVRQTGMAGDEVD